LKTERDALATALSAGGLVPTTIGQGLTAAADQYRQANDLGKNFKDTVIMNIGGGIETLHNSFTDLFTTLTTGSGSALGAFASFAKGVMTYIAQMAAKFAASQIMNLVLSLVGSSFSAGITSGANSALNAATPSTTKLDTSILGSTASLFGNYEGGPALTRLRGGEVMNGDDKRDSVNTKLAKGEYVMQKSAVDSVGTQFMARLNTRGADALKSQQSSVQPMMMAPEQKMSVYVVAPEQKPSLSKSDVLVAFAEDVLQNGETKKLIKFVSQGG